MNGIAVSEPLEQLHHRHRALTGLLELVLRNCELPPDLFARAQDHYAEKTTQLKGCEWLRQFPLRLTPQGSIATGTTVAPLRRKHGEFDVDLLLIFEIAHTLVTPAELHRRVGDRLHVDFAKEISVLRLGWMLDYAWRDRFHFDVIPAVTWRHWSGITMLAATDWKADKWKPTNPEAFAAGFLKTGGELPLIEDPIYNRLNARSFMAANFAEEARVDPLPENTPLKSPLQRMTQLTKRFRDIWFSHHNGLDRRTPSIVVTTLLWQAYARYVANKPFPSVFAVLRTMADNFTDPDVLKVERKDGTNQYTLINPTVPGENLIARWNEAGNEREAAEFFGWAADFKKFIGLIEKAEGRHQLDPLITGSLGSDSVSPVLKRITEAMYPARERIDLGFSPKLGITAATTAGAIGLRRHTFHGEP